VELTATLFANELKLRVWPEASRELLQISALFQAQIYCCLAQTLKNKALAKVFNGRRR